MFLLSFTFIQLLIVLTGLFLDIVMLHNPHPLQRLFSGITFSSSCVLYNKEFFMHFLVMFADFFFRPKPEYTPLHISLYEVLVYKCCRLQTSILLLCPTNSILGLFF